MARTNGEIFKLAKKIYVGNLSFQTTEEEVRELFSEYGSVESVAMISDRDTGRFRGFCFVEMDSEAADAAIAALDGKEVGGRSLRVNEAKPREERGGGNRGGFRGGGNRGQRQGGKGYQSDSRKSRNRRDTYSNSDNDGW